MDRRAALALVVVAIVLALLSAVAWSLPAPLDPWRTMVNAQGERLLYDVPDDMSLIVQEALLQAARRAFPLTALVALLAAVPLAVVNRPNRWLRPVAVLVPLTLAAAVSALCFTPPDVITTVLFFAPAQGLLVCLGLVSLVLVGGLRAEGESSSIADEGD